MRQIGVAVATMLLCLPWPVLAQQAWYLESSTMLLEPANRYVATVVATNPTQQPIYVRTSVTALRVQDGRRERAPDAEQVISVYPAELVLHPGSSFALRVVADARKLKDAGQSFYVKLRDVSQAVADGQGSAMMSSTLLAHEVLVAVSPRNTTALNAGVLELRRDGEGLWALVNRSGQHVYVQGGHACEDNRRALNTCTRIDAFPRQSVLVDEAIRIPAPQAPYLGVLLQPSLHAQSRPQALFVSVPR
jgi:P pilus assembly chaperone PapD